MSCVVMDELVDGLRTAGWCQSPAAGGCGEKQLSSELVKLLSTQARRNPRQAFRAFRELESASSSTSASQESKAGPAVVEDVIHGLVCASAWLGVAGSEVQ